MSSNQDQNLIGEASSKYGKDTPEKNTPYEKSQHLPSLGLSNKRSFLDTVSPGETDGIEKNPLSKRAKLETSLQPEEQISADQRNPVDTHNVGSMFIQVPELTKSLLVCNSEHFQRCVPSQCTVSQEEYIPVEKKLHFLKVAIDSGNHNSCAAINPEPANSEITKTLSSSLLTPETNKEVENASKTILVIKAKRQQDRTIYERSRLFRRKHGFGHIKRNFRMRKITKKHIQQHLKNNLQVQLQTISIPLALDTPQTEKNDCMQGIKNQNRESVFSTGELEHCEGVATCSVLRTCSRNRFSLQKQKGLKSHGQRRNKKEMQFYCHACGYSCMTRGNFEKHCQSNRHQMAKINFECHICGAVSSDLTNFNSHMNVYHNMSFQCTICKLYFSLKEELEHHEKTEQHIQMQKSAEEHPLQASISSCCQLRNKFENLPKKVKVATEQNISVPLKENAEKKSHFESGRPQFQCKKCFYKTRSSTVLTRHIKLRHAHNYHFLCKACNIYSMCKEGMEKHIKRSKHIENARKNNIGLLFDECIEKVWFDGITDSNVAGKDSSESHSFLLTQSLSKEIFPTTDEPMFPSQDSTEIDLLGNAPKRGRPKGNISRLCNYCGLLASSVTNLSVHVRRKHSHQYSYLCKVCNYYTVTKGDMERHCSTKKHKTRVAEEKNGLQKSDIVVTSDGRHFEGSVQKKESLALLDNGHINSATSENTIVLPDTQGTPSSVFSENGLADNTIYDVQVAGEEADNSKDSNYLHRVLTENGNNKCTQCDFVGLSHTSLEKHIKKLHSKKFQYYCMACEHYAVTHKKMMGHVLTEKHRINYQVYKARSLSTMESNADNGQQQKSSDMCKLVRGNKEFPQVLHQNLKLNLEVQSHTSNLNENNTLELEDSKTCAMEYIKINTKLKQSSQDSNVTTEKGQEDVIKENHTNTLEDNEIILNAQSDVVMLEADNEVEVCLVDEVLEMDTISGFVAPDLNSVNGSLQSNQNRDEFDSSIVRLDTCLAGEARAPQLSKRKRSVGKSNGETARIRCDDCGFLADGLSGLNVHIAMKHPTKEKHFHCLLCGKSFYNESNLHQHLASVGHLKNELESFEELPEGGVTFKCVKCTEHFDSEQSLFVHIKVQHEELLREVNKYIEEDTEQINKEREENKGNVCKYCGKKCKSSNSMAFLAHIRTHTGSKPFKCKICHFAAAQLGDARNHVKRHLGMREYKCHVCG
ncbi:hypothetical protein GDO86_011169 [Hymenochirus boettgeri]|uniref:C2H2-type domain-containing protein n=1 Tax=Hymenochirus boettgeri TaxID=247094 RepID=A0A8T2JAI4_9PIPI|nr:hypothetical protein GDO86_011169 [Hymenochirus boettgeri]